MAKDGEGDAALVRRASEWVSDILRRNGWDGTRLARAAGLSPSTVLRMVSDKGTRIVPRLVTLGRLAKASGHPVPVDIMDAYGVPAGDGPRHQDPYPVIPLRYVSDKPGVRPTGPSVRAPTRFRGDPTAFAFHLNENSLDPLFPQGSLLYATKARPPLPGDVLVLTRLDGTSVVRLLTDHEDDALVTRRGVPDPVTERMPFADLVDVSVVVSMQRP